MVTAWRSLIGRNATGRLPVARRTPPFCLRKTTSGDVGMFRCPAPSRRVLAALPLCSSRSSQPDCGARRRTVQTAADRSAAHRSRARRRRRARHRARRRDPRARRAAHSDRLRRRHQHGFDRRRSVRNRHDVGPARRSDTAAELVRHLRRQHDSRGASVSAQTRRRPRAVRTEVRCGSEVVAAAARRDQRSEDPVLPADRDQRTRSVEELRRAADSVPRDRGGHRHRQARRHFARRPRDRDAREHVDSGLVLADRFSGTPARGRRHRQQPAGQRRAGHGRGHSHRRRRRHAAVHARRTDRLRFDHESAQRHHGGEQHRASGIAADAEGRADRAEPR